LPTKTYSFVWDKPSFPGTIIAGVFQEYKSNEAGIDLHILFKPLHQKLAQTYAETAVKEFTYYVTLYGPLPNTTLRVIELPDDTVPSAWDRERCNGRRAVTERVNYRLLANTIAHQWWGASSVLHRVTIGGWRMDLPGIQKRVMWKVLRELPDSKRQSKICQSGLWLTTQSPCPVLCPSCAIARYVPAPGRWCQDGDGKRDARAPATRRGRRSRQGPSFATVRICASDRYWAGRGRSKAERVYSMGHTVARVRTTVMDSSAPRGQAGVPPAAGPSGALAAASP